MELPHGLVAEELATTDPFVLLQPLLEKARETASMLKLGT
jgi:hypothetical protein